MDVMWTVVSAMGSLLIAFATGVMSFFLRRYINHQDVKNDKFFQSIARLENTTTEIRNLIEMQNLSCTNKMTMVEKDVHIVQDKVQDHEKRIKKVEIIVYKPRKKKEAQK